MKYTIDDAAYIINMIILIYISQYVKNSSHSHSIINKPFVFDIQWLIFLPNGNTMKNTMFRICCNSIVGKAGRVLSNSIKLAS